MLPYVPCLEHSKPFAKLEREYSYILNVNLIVSSDLEHSKHYSAMFHSTLKRYLKPHALCSLVVVSTIQHNQAPPSTTPLQLQNIQRQTNPTLTTIMAEHGLCRCPTSPREGSFRRNRRAPPGICPTCSQALPKVSNINIQLF
jgi:hypothetical protein